MGGVSDSPSKEADTEKDSKSQEGMGGTPMTPDADTQGSSSIDSQNCPKISRYS